eukprot:COSAG02_NODE_7808_length_2837_cov_3.525201_1_plen_166_part_10
MMRSAPVLNQHLHFDALVLCALGQEIAEGSPRGLRSGELPFPAPNYPIRESASLPTFTGVWLCPHRIRLVRYSGCTGIRTDSVYLVGLAGGSLVNEKNIHSVGGRHEGAYNTSSIRPSRQAPPSRSREWRGQRADGSNSFKQWFWRHKITRSLHDNDNEPWVQQCW